MTEALTTAEQRLFADVRAIIEEARRSVRTGINAVQIDHNWRIGRRIVEEEQNGEARAEYGKSVIANLSAKLTAEYGAGYSERSLWEYRRFYRTFPDAGILHTRVRNLNWSHFRQLMRVADEKARLWYMDEAEAEGWSSHQLRRQISVLYRERMLASGDKDGTRADARANLRQADLPRESFIKSPYVLEFLGLGDYPGLHEADIENGIISRMGEFLLELGRGFCFVARQKRIDMDGRDFYIDLVFYNIFLKCYVLIDLKLGELTYQDIGQMDGYVRLYEERYRRADDNPTIGLLLCSKKNEAVARYSVLNESKQLFASKYLLELPTEDELRREIERERFLLESRKAAGTGEE
jgi:predicted nuclease of restriction endonuclease-like (RecB) superfamily